MTCGSGLPVAAELALSPWEHLASLVSISSSHPLHVKDPFSLVYFLDPPHDNHFFMHTHKCYQLMTLLCGFVCHIND